MTNEYLKQAQKFLINTRTKVSIIFIENGQHFDGEKDLRDIYQITMTNSKGGYTFRYGDSTQNSRYRLFNKTGDNGRRLWVQPNVYDILSCLTSHDPESFDDFCDSYGYDNDSISALKVYEAVKSEYAGMCLLFNEEQREVLSDIS